MTFKPVVATPSQIPEGVAKSLAVFSADELKQECRKLQQDNLQLKQERQNLLEKVASLEKRLSNKKEIFEV